MPAPRSLGLRALHVFVASYGDNNHAGGLLGVEPNIRIRKLISNRKNLRSKLPAQLHSDSYDWNWNGVEFRFLQRGLDYASKNNHSCVLQIRSKVVAVYCSEISIERRMHNSREAMSVNSGVMCYLLLIMEVEARRARVCSVLCRLPL